MRTPDLKAPAMKALKAMQRRQLHSRPASEQQNGVDDRLKEGSLTETADKPSSPGREVKARRPSGQDVYDDGTKTFFW